VGSLCTSTTTGQTQLPEWLTNAAPGRYRHRDGEPKPFVAYDQSLTAGLSATQQREWPAWKGPRGLGTAVGECPERPLGRAQHGWRAFNRHPLH